VRQNSSTPGIAKINTRQGKQTDKSQITDSKTKPETVYLLSVSNILLWVLEKPKNFLPRILLCMIKVRVRAKANRGMLIRKAPISSYMAASWIKISTDITRTLKISGTSKLLRENMTTNRQLPKIWGEINGRLIFLRTVIGELLQRAVSSCLASTD